LIEEYFDGEVRGQAGERIGAHLSACTDCSAALDALSFEQEVYARYDRGGLEVTPDLWARVSAEIARTPPTEVPAEGRPFLSRARGYLAAALGALAVRPALASSLALLLVAAAVGTLWLSRRTPPSVPAPEVARQEIAAPPVTVIPQASHNGEADANVTPGVGLQAVNEGETASGVYAPRASSPHVAGAPGPVEIAPDRAAAEDAVAKMLEPPPAPPATHGLVEFQPEEAAPVDETAALLVNASVPVGEGVAQPARLLDPEEKDVARHVERAQMLLRSIKNVRASDADGADVAYEKDLSRKLLAENATLQLEAEVRGDKETRQVLDRIEPFLLEIANMGEKPSREEVRSIRERVRQNEIVAALEVY